MSRDPEVFCLVPFGFGTVGLELVRAVTVRAVTLRAVPVPAVADWVVPVRAVTVWVVMVCAVEVEAERLEVNARAVGTVSRDAPRGGHSMGGGSLGIVRLRAEDVRAIKGTLGEQRFEGKNTRSSNGRTPGSMFPFDVPIRSPFLA